MWYGSPTIFHFQQWDMYGQNTSILLPSRMFPSQNSCLASWYSPALIADLTGSAKLWLRKSLNLRLLKASRTCWSDITSSLPYPNNVPLAMCKGSLPKSEHRAEQGFASTRGCVLMQAPQTCSSTLGYSCQ